MDDCIFCKIAKGEIPSEKVLENDNFIVIKDINPMTEGHSLVIPKKHYTTFLDVPPSLFGEYMETAKEAVFILLKETKAEGFNLLMSNFKVAQQEVPHVHLHIVPRKKGDGNFKFLKD
ncbi:HIT family protein [archaeon]|nr:HIT family protein [archaeon]